MRAKTILLLGIALIICGLIYDMIFAGIPYQDPTPAMTQKYNFHRFVANAIELIGLIGIIAGTIKGSLKKAIKNKVYNNKIQIMLASMLITLGPILIYISIKFINE
jgi:hypothetical protein